MLLVVENVRKKQLAWVKAILDHKGVNASRAAKEAGINPGTLKMLHDGTHHVAVGRQLGAADHP